MSGKQVRPWYPGDEAEIFARSAESPDDIDMIVIGHAEWERTVQAACRAVGLTPHELWECSLDDSFPSLRARKLWLATGYHVWPDPGDDDAFREGCPG